MQPMISRQAFLQMPTQEVAGLVRALEKPRLGVFVPDGSRRYVLAFTDVDPNSEAFYRLSALLPAQQLLESLQILFAHGLPVLLAPILSSSVLSRGDNYLSLTALTGLALLFADETWQTFYQEYGIRVRVYGDLSLLTGSACAPALDWIEATIRRTEENQAHTLFYAIGEPATLGQGVADLGVSYFQENGRAPTLDEQIRHYYGELLPPADFFLMTSKMSGMGALPRFLVNGDTEVYFLPAAGAMGLNADTWRLILYDMLFERVGLQGGYVEESMSLEERAALGRRYQAEVSRVIGLGERIGQVWVAR